MSDPISNLTHLMRPEHTTWACIHQPSCVTPELPRGDLACFKYSHIRGEFHFWGWNRHLALVAPLFQVQTSFCEPDDALSGKLMSSWCKD